MGIVWNIVRVVIVAVTVVAVAELSKRHPRYGALLLSLPIVSILAFLRAGAVVITVAPHSPSRGGE